MGLSIEEQREKIREKKRQESIRNEKNHTKYKPNGGYKFHVDELLVRGVYFLYQDNLVVYIGQSKQNVMERISKHFTDETKVFNRFRFQAKNELTDKKLDLLEKQLIKKYKPKYNSVYCKPRRAKVIYGHGRTD